MTDIFRDRKLVHVKLDKDTHSVLRSELFKAGLTMQEILSEFCRQYINKAPHAIKLVEGYVIRKNRYKIQALEEQVRDRKEQYAMTDADKAALYDLLDETTPLGRPSKEQTEDDDEDV
jgi:hypothetical protein